MTRLNTLRLKNCILLRENFLQALVVWQGYLEPTWKPLPFIYHTDAYKNYKKRIGIVNKFFYNN